MSGERHGLAQKEVKLPGTLFDVCSLWHRTMVHGCTYGFINAVYTFMYVVCCGLTV